MPASMIRAEVGGTLKVIGSSIAMVASGPIPGSTPISVPRKQPMKQNHRFWSVKATLKPSIKLLNSSISVSYDERIREAEAPDEQRPRADREAYRHDEHFGELELRSGVGRNEDQHDQRWNEARVFHQHTKNHGRD